MAVIKYGGGGGGDGEQDSIIHATFRQRHDSKAAKQRRANYKIRARFRNRNRSLTRYSLIIQYRESSNCQGMSSIMRKK